MLSIFFITAAMNKKLLLYFFIFLSIPVFATRQSPDTLVYKNKVMSLLTSWGHPSPLQAFYFQNKIAYPFKKISTGNYRGHIASWEISKDSLFLTKVYVKENNYPLNNIKEQASEKIFADWFSGVIHCRHFDNDDELKAIYLLVVEKGAVKEVEKTKKFSKLTSNKLWEIQNDYVAFYFRLKNDYIYLNGKAGLLQTNKVLLSPIFQYYGNTIFDWPYNWSNRERNGAPHCEWLIENKKLYLKSFELYSGLRYDSCQVEKIALTEIAKPEKNNFVFAEKVSGVFKIYHGEPPAIGDASAWFHFSAEAITYFKVENGIIIENYTLDKNFNTDIIDENAYPDLAKLIRDYNNQIK